MFTFTVIPLQHKLKSVTATGSHIDEAHPTLMAGDIGHPVFPCPALCLLKAICHLAFFFLSRLCNMVIFMGDGGVSNIRPTITLESKN